MKTQETYVGWDFATIRNLDPDSNGGYPSLSWERGEDTPPVLTETSASSLTQTTAALQFTSDKAGTYYCLVYAAAEAAPDVAAIKAQGDAAAAVIIAGKTRAIHRQPRLMKRL